MQETTDRNEQLRSIVHDAIVQLGDDEGQDIFVTDAVMIATVTTLEGGEQMWLKATQATPWVLAGIMQLASGKIQEILYGEEGGDDE